MLRFPRWRRAATAPSPSTRRGSRSGAAAWPRWAIGRGARVAPGGAVLRRRRGRTPDLRDARASLIAAGLDVVTYTDVHVEPTDASFLDAARFAHEMNPDGYVSLGGGSVIDTCKAANLFATYPATCSPMSTRPSARATGARPAQAAHRVPDDGRHRQRGHRHRDLRLAGAVGEDRHRLAALRPSEALVDPDCTASLPAEVVAAAGLDVLSHALESYTARPYVHRPAPPRPACGR